MNNNELCTVNNYRNCSNIGRKALLGEQLSIGAIFSQEELLKLMDTYVRVVYNFARFASFYCNWE